MPDGPSEQPDILADAARMAAIAGGDAAAFEAAARAHSPRLVSLGASLLGNRAEAEEVAQEALLRLWQQAPRWQPKARISTWLHSVAYRLSIDRLRRRRPGAPVSEIEDMPDDNPSPEDALLHRQRASLIDAALDRLAPRQRAAVVLAHGRGLGQAEAAAILGMSEDAYESLLARARRRLKELVADARPAGGGGRQGDG